METDARLSGSGPRSIKKDECRRHGHLKEMAKLNKTLLSIIICRYCHKKITRPGLVGMSPVCPYCKIPVNGQYHP